jgi:23S rRNA pseudouridine2605 synthase
VRLNQYLARAGFGSRRACEELILEGAVTINGHRLRELATRVGAEDNVLVHGNLAQRLTHPSTKMRKTYIVTLDKEFDFALAPKMKKGISIEEGFARMDDIYRVGPRTLKVVLTQGLKRQIREMFFKVGYEVKRLVRIQIGNLLMENLPVGQHRVLTQEDVKRYFPSGPAARPAKKKFPAKAVRSAVKKPAKKELPHG